jgi:hypothetical protein
MKRSAIAALIVATFAVAACEFPVMTDQREALIPLPATTVPPVEEPIDLGHEVCEVEGFTTAVFRPTESCDVSFWVGVPLLDEHGHEGDGARWVIARMCAAAQSARAEVFEDRALVDIAHALLLRDVCPGDPGRVIFIAAPSAQRSPIGSPHAGVTP